jgi:hypothetical protein
MLWDAAPCGMVIITGILEDHCALSSGASSPRIVMDPDDEGCMILQNISTYLPTDML